ncbi:WG repeat-containing protein [Clostridium lacusfryxellense]|uniref:WG repeat-containing protein n=1 Tax=Clostridium lacusfryxellense TaxID=205328 RepID=UPI001C0B34EF|nr:WG repeat-containing protein [Clostridium lacusfryxellense]MBU3112349.1 WG repeat-containing protein [Clostridium lacusfryxellense]
MKSKVSVIALIVIVIIASWGISFNNQHKKAERLSAIKQEIKTNEKLGVYKRVISLYKELITLDDKNIELYSKLANSYKNVEQNKNYEETCNVIIKKFPNNIRGYLELAKYYAKDERHDVVIELHNRLPESLINNKEFIDIYKNSEYKFIYLSRSYQDISQFTNDFAVVEQKDLYGYVDKGTSEVIDPKFTSAKAFIEDKAAVFNKNEWYFIDKEGDKILATSEKVEDLHSISEGYASVKINGKYGFVDEKFNKVKIDYDYTTNFYNGVAAVKKGDKWSIISKDFKAVTGYIYEDIVFDDSNICSRNGIIFAKKDGKYSMLDLTGTSITKDTYEAVKMFASAEPAALKKNSKWGFVNSKGKVIIDFKYDDADSFSLGIAPVSINGKWGYINLKGEIVIPNEFDGAKPFYKSGVASVKVESVYRFIELIKYR